jgi:hypothetical protein
MINSSKLDSYKKIGNDDQELYVRIIYINEPIEQDVIITTITNSIIIRSMQTIFCKTRWKKLVEKSWMIGLVRCKITEMKK